MLPFFSLLLIIFLGANCQNHSDSFIQRISFSYVCIIGSTITTGLLAGFFSFRITDLIVRLLFITALAVLVLLNLRRFILKTSRAHSGLPDSFFIGVLPGFFLLSTGLLFVLRPTRNMHFLLATWDGSSNPGMVTGLREFEQLNAFPPLKGVENYPAGSHYVASWLADLFPTSFLNSPLMTIHSFTALLFLSYCLIVALVGQLSNELGMLSNQNRSMRLSMGLVAQSVLLTPFFIKNLLLMFSLSFITALATTLALLLIFVKKLHRRSDSGGVQPIIAFSLALIVIINTYQTFLFVAFLMFVFLVTSTNTRQIVKNLAGDLSYQMSLIFFSFSLSVALLQLTLTTNSVAATTTSRFSLVGHIITIDIRFVVFISVLSLGILFFKNTRVLLGYFLLSVFATVLISWWLSESFSRAYGLNYYAKKSEYMLIVLLIPMTTTFMGFLLRQVVALFPFRIIRVGMSLGLIAFSSICIQRGPYASLLKPSLDNVAEEQLMGLALREAGIGGRSIVWNELRPDISRNASLMSNYVDLTSWVEPDSHSLTYVMAQQLSIRTDDPWSESCGYLASRQFGIGRIVSVKNGLLWECS